MKLKSDVASFNHIITKIVSNLKGKLEKEVVKVHFKNDFIQTLIQKRFLQVKKSKWQIIP